MQTASVLPCIVIVIVIVIFKQGVCSAQADFQRSPVYITHKTTQLIATYIHTSYSYTYNTHKQRNTTTKI